LDEKDLPGNITESAMGMGGVPPSVVRRMTKPVPGRREMLPDTRSGLLLRSIGVERDIPSFVPSPIFARQTLLSAGFFGGAATAAV
jgi:hypothetical protein